MKTHFKVLFLLPALIAGLGLLPVGRAVAQTFSNLHSFRDVDGGNLPAGVILSSNILYGTTKNYGGNLGGGAGTVFKLSTDGTVFTNLHVFTTPTGAGPLTNSDGAYPFAGLILAGNTLYGTTDQGGKGAGAVFKVNIDGTGFTNLYSFTTNSTTFPNTNADGSLPMAGLVLAGGTLYGEAWLGGNRGNGTIFALSTNGGGFTNLHNFAAIDGVQPSGGLILAGKNLYGTAGSGGTNGAGSIFVINTNGTGFMNLYSFTVPTGPKSNTNADGAFPGGSLILAGNNLFGTTSYGGVFGGGTLFAVNTNGQGFITLHSFTATVGTSPATNRDGLGPNAALTLSSNLLYGTAFAGGSAGNGTVFVINTNGTGFITLYDFTALDIFSQNPDGAAPISSLVLSNNILYGTTSKAGGFGYGSVFSLWLSPVLNLTRSSTNVIVTWPTNLPGYTLQFTTNLAPAPAWFTVVPAPSVVSTNNAVTNGISGTHKFYRLTQ